LLLQQNKHVLPPGKKKKMLALPKSNALLLSKLRQLRLNVSSKRLLKLKLIV
jgi:hypothetical protein